MNIAQDLTAAVDAGFEDQIQALTDLVAIQSVSSDPERNQELWQSARFVRDAFAELGLDARIAQAPVADGVMGAPAVIAKSSYQEGKPRVLLYAHHDVQPEGDAERWSSDPFTAEIRGDRIYGRGTSDDGAGIVVHLGALRALEQLGPLPVNVTVFVEGEEEVGSPSFANFLATNEDDLAADVIIVADSGNWTADVPAVTSTLRGVATLDVKVKVLDHAVHSGFFGGPVLDAVTLSSRLISTLHGEDGAVAVAGLGGEPTAEVDWPEEDFRKEASVLEGYRLAGTADLAARVWTMPAISVIGMDAVSVADSANAIIPECTFRLSVRTVPGSDAGASAEAVQEHLLANAPFGCSVEVAIKELGPSYRADLDSREAGLLREVLGQAWGTDAVSMGIGGSIPFIAQFEETLPEAKVLVTGIEDPSTNAHSEDESQSLKVLRNATLAEALLLQRLGEPASE